MFSYLLNRWLFARQFQQDGDGYLYRRNPRSAAVRVTGDERRAFIRQFTRTYWKYHLSLFGAGVTLIPLTVVLAAILLGEVPETVILFIVYSLAIGIFVAIVLINRRLMNQPAKALEGRSPVLAPRTRRDIRDGWIGNISWFSLAVRSLLLAGLAWLTFPRPDAPLWWPIGWTVYFGGLVVVMARNAWRKVQLDRGQA